MSGETPTLSAPRYTYVTFPRYRFVPGCSPHPTAHPAGHSYVPAGQDRPPVRWVPPERWHESEDYLHATDLYNHGYWWEAHEAWEGLWQLTDKAGLQGLFLQGLIQVAACHLKLHVGQRAGVERLLTTSTNYLRRAVSSITTTPTRYMGLDVAGFVGQVVRYYRTRLGREPLAHDVRTYPYITLSPQSDA